MKHQRLGDYLDHIAQAALDAQGFVEGMDEAGFLADKRTQQAVVMSFIIMGEAATRLMDGYPDFVQARSEVSWRSMRNMRNRMAHGYFDIDPSIVWGTLRDWVPGLLEQLAAIRESGVTETPDDPTGKAG
ncbi:HepT-like ribonuclease domain-containing protein [Pigmentiphaga litoralis]|uniref:Uncharacterized protein with HEPN domain n=1 Tax=Pigmentiphaga litoralis TaxID=516702 RepID=A0A7Y9IW98_9BURK|nr:DUF86 domain-containing protein [Pigmentiphaga litoralis]NYE22420.1 uncharacterized protein with HEPN domain [Pigmentiphaga litoralis]NYE83965.1 uncharacterized protein with HEPN domain [Pigmentiphaga litoralis]